MTSETQSTGVLYEHIEETRKYRMIVKLILYYVLIDYGMFNYDVDFELPEKFMVKGYRIRINNEENIFQKFLKPLTLIKIYYTSNRGYFSFTESFSNTTVEVDDQTINICQNYTSCNEYGRSINITVEELKGKTLVMNYLGDPYSYSLSYDNDKSYVLLFVKLLSEALRIRIRYSDLDAYILKISNRILSTDEVIYTSPIFDVSTVFLIRAARPLDRVINLGKPLDKWVWISLSITLLVFVLCAYGILRKKAQMKNENHPKFFNILWILFKQLVRQDVDENHIILRTYRIMIGGWLLMIFIITSGYLGILPSFMMFSEKEKIPENFPEMAQAIKEDKYIPNVFRQSEESENLQIRSLLDLLLDPSRRYFENEVLQVFHTKIKESEMASNYTEVVDQVLNNNVVFLAPKIFFEALLMKYGKEKFFLSQDILFTNFRFIQIVPDRFYYAPEIVRMINILHQTGIPEKIQKDITEEDKRYYEFYSYKEENLEVPLKMEDIMAPLYLLLSGYVISTFVFTAEIMIHKIIKKMA